MGLGTHPKLTVAPIFSAAPLVKSHRTVGVAVCLSKNRYYIPVRLSSSKSEEPPVSLIRLREDNLFRAGHRRLVQFCKRMPVTFRVRHWGPHVCWEVRNSFRVCLYPYRGMSLEWCPSRASADLERNESAIRSIIQHILRTCISVNTQENAA